ncbi:hypothetical protein HLB44_00215 [Aquincola sp. S2]|uniref:Uncharacterized protein n=1 Tax=Pseudaquabacterium terrae TaxID=2732868 RepID=A0ABX2EA79_9BURK|nr:hypothetical protein [Aquabacterium terrae]NRF65396.1 hypothetical protein [Aquabacterium terrae]
MVVRHGLVVGFLGGAGLCLSVSGVIIAATPAVGAAAGADTPGALLMNAPDQHPAEHQVPEHMPAPVDAWEALFRPWR